MLLFTLLTSLLVHAVEPPERKTDRLVDLFDCGSLMKPALPVTAISGYGKRLLVSPRRADSFFDARDLIENRIKDPQGLFRIGWIPNDPRDFQYLVRARLFDGTAPGVPDVLALKKTSLARQKSPVGRVLVHLSNGRDMEYTLAAQKNPLSVSFDDEDVTRAIGGADARIEHVTFWIWHPNGNPPLPSEITEVRSLAIIQLWTKKPFPKVSLKVAGESWGGIVLFETEIPPPELDETRPGLVRK